MTREIPLIKGAVTLVDDDVFEWASSHTWNLHSNGYASRSILGGLKKVYLHRAILDPAPGAEVDHINGNKLDNRRANLRECTHAQNGANVRKSASRRSNEASLRFKGVRRARNNRWVAKISTGGTFIHLGTFDTEEDAARAYDAAALAHFGQYAHPNNP